jgi:predicted  nucleic acid-binding Zn-ribbon protein
MKCYLCEHDAEIRKTPDINRDQFVKCEYCGRYILA